MLFRKQTTGFIRQQIKQVYSGGLPVLWRKIGAFPRWLSVQVLLPLLPPYVYKLAIAIKPDWAEAHAQLAETLIRLGRFDEAFVGVGFQAATGLDRSP